MTLIELMIVLTIVATATGTAVLSVRALARTTARASAGRLGAAIRYLYDRAVTTGGYYRLVIDVTGNKYWAERADKRFYLVRDDPRARDRDEEEKRRRREEEEERAKFERSNLGMALEPPPMPRPARFEAFKDATLPRVDLKGAKIRDVYTARQREPLTEGKALLYFFPDGHTERALIHVEDGEGDVYTLVVHPLTGRVEMQTGDVPLPQGFGETDDEGQGQAPR